LYKRNILRTSRSKNGAKSAQKTQEKNRHNMVLDIKLQSQQEG
jgi:hypothetical protein